MFKRLLNKLNKATDKESTSIWKNNRLSFRDQFLTDIQELSIKTFIAYKEKKASGKPSKEELRDLKFEFYISNNQIPNNAFVTEGTKLFRIKIKNK